MGCTVHIRVDNVMSCMTYVSRADLCQPLEIVRVAEGCSNQPVCALVFPHSFQLTAVRVHNHTYRCTHGVTAPSAGVVPDIVGV
jgi:hypothetical protein